MSIPTPAIERPLLEIKNDLGQVVGCAVDEEVVGTIRTPRQLELALDQPLAPESHVAVPWCVEDD